MNRLRLDDVTINLSSLGVVFLGLPERERSATLPVSGNRLFRRPIVPSFTRKLRATSRTFIPAVSFPIAIWGCSNAIPARRPMPRFLRLCSGLFSCDHNRINSCEFPLKWLIRTSPARAMCHYWLLTLGSKRHDLCWHRELLPCLYTQAPVIYIHIIHKYNLPLYWHTFR